MAIEKLSYTGSDGQTVTAPLSGYDVITATGGTEVFEDSYAPRDSTVSILSTGTSTSGVIYGRKAFTASDVLAFDLPVTPKALPSAELYFFVAASGSGTTRCFALATTSTGLLRVRDAANANAWSSAAGALVADSPCIISLYATRDPSAGSFRVVVYEADGETVRVDSGAQTGKNTGAASFEGFFLGAKASTSTLESSWLLGEPRWDVAATGLLPAWSPQPSAASPVFRWDGEYIPLSAYRWDEDTYTPVVSV